MTAQQSPVATSGRRSSGRLANVDALRGFALLGILAVNIWAFADPFYAETASNPAFDSRLDNLIRFTISLLFETKFYLLFSFLFGYSFTLQMAAAQRAGASFIPRMLRRQAGLLAIGLAHGALLYYGEILSLYAILGLILLACRNISPARAVKIGAGLVLVAGSVWMLLGLAEMAEGQLTGAGSVASGAASKLTAFGGNAGATLSFHIGHLPGTFATLALLQGPSAMAMFFFGFAAGRAQVFADPDPHRPMVRRALLVGLPIGLAGALVYALSAAYSPGGGIEIFAFGVGQVTAPLLTASYVAAALALWRTRIGGRIEAALAPTGKIALSNYLGQSALLGVVFTGYGFGLIDRLSPLAVVALVPGIYLMQVLLSHWWLRSHQYGPGEWALRAVTIARIPAWRIPAAKPLT